MAWMACSCRPGGGKGRHLAQHGFEDPGTAASHDRSPAPDPVAARSGIRWRRTCSRASWATRLMPPARVTGRWRWYCRRRCWWADPVQQQEGDPEGLVLLRLGGQLVALDGDPAFSLVPAADCPASRARDVDPLVEVGQVGAVASTSPRRRPGAVVPACCWRSHLVAADHQGRSQAQVSLRRPGRGDSRPWARLWVPDC